MTPRRLDILFMAARAASFSKFLLCAIIFRDAMPDSSPITPRPAIAEIQSTG